MINRAYLPGSCACVKLCVVRIGCVQISVFCLKFISLNDKSCPVDSQHGFHESKLILTIDDITRSLGSTSSVDVAVLDIDISFTKFSFMGSEGQQQHGFTTSD